MFYGWSVIQNCQRFGLRRRKLIILPRKKIDKLVKKCRQGNILVNVEYQKELCKKHNELSFLEKRMKIEKVEKLIPNLQNKKTHAVHITSRSNIKAWFETEVHRVIRFQQCYWKKPYNIMSSKIKIDADNEFEKHFFKLMSNSVFGKILEKITNNKDMKLVKS